MSAVDWSLLPPSPWTEDELREIVRAHEEERRARGMERPTEEQLRESLMAWLAEADAKRGYALPPEEKERRRFQHMFEGRVLAARWRRMAPFERAEYACSPGPPLLLREGRPEESQLDRIERNLTATRVQLEDLNSRVQSYSDYNATLAAKVDELGARIEALARTIERLDLRVLSLEHRMTQVEERLARLEQRVERLEQRIEGLEQRVDRLEQRVERIEQRVERIEPGEPR